MSRVEMIATKAMRYGHKPLAAGQHFLARARDVRLLKAINKAVLPTAQPLSKEEAAATPPRARSRGKA
jgi:hypothetical protein